MTAEDFDRFFEAYLSGSLTPDGAAALREALKDPQWQRRWRELSDMDGMLAEEFKVQSETIAPPKLKTKGVALRKASRAQRKTVRGYFGMQGAIAAAILLIAVLGLAMYFRSSSAPEAIVATLKDVSGEVLLLRGETRVAAKIDQSITEGDGLQAAPKSRATLLFADGTSLVLSGDTESRLWL